MLLEELCRRTLCHIVSTLEAIRFDVLTPEDIVEALTYDGGVKNTFVDYIKVDRGHERLLEYEFASLCKLQAMLGSLAEIRYEHVSQTEYNLKTYRYSNCCFRKSHVDGVQSAEIIDPEHKKTVDWEEPPTHEEYENGL